MAVILRELVRQYRLVIYEYGDKRTQDWPLQGSPWPTISILAAWLWFVKIGGPAMMKDRKPYNIDKIIQVYNVFQIIICTYLFVMGYYYAYSPWGRYNFLCEAVDYTDNEFNQKVLRLIYTYALLKMVDLLETVFFTLRKKDSQVTFLHIYHHILMVTLTWVGMRYAPGGNSVFVGIINSFVHAVMYLYYFVTNWRPEHKKNVWWKKYITQLQMLQFAILFIHSSQVLITSPNCTYPRILILANLPQNLFIFLLFADFYRKKYLKKPTKDN